MARTIGNVEVTVDAKTGHLVADLTKAGKQGGKAAKKAAEKELRDVKAELRLDEGSIRAKAAKLKSDLERVLDIRPEVTLETAKAKAEMYEFEKRAARTDIEMRVVIDAARATAELESMHALWERESIDLDIEADLKEAQKTIAIFRKLQERNEIEIGVDFDLDTFEAAVAAAMSKNRVMGIDVEPEVAEAYRVLEQFELRYKSNPLTIPTEATTEKARAALALLRTRQKANAIEIPVELDVDFIDNKLKTAAARHGNAGGNQFSKAFWDAITPPADNMELIVKSFVSLGDAITGALSGGAAAATAVLSSGLHALAGAAGTAGVAMAATGAGITALVVGSQGMGDAFSSINSEFAAATKEGRAFNQNAEEIREALAGLSPNARDAAVAFAGIRGELDNVKNSVQQELFRGISDEINDLAQNALPDISVSLQMAAQEMNAFGKDMSSVVQNTNFTEMFEAMRPTVQNLRGAVVSLSKTIEPMLKAAAPAAERLTQAFQNAADKAAKFVNSTDGMDKLTSFFDGAGRSLQKWMSLLSTAGGLLATVFAAGKATGDGFVVSLDNMLARWDQMLELDPTILSDFFNRGKQAIDALIPVAEGLGDAFKTLGGDESVSNFEDLAEAVGAILPVLAELLHLSGNLGVMTKMMSSLGVALGVVSAVLSAMPDWATEVLGWYLAASSFYGMAVKLGPALTAMSGGLKTVAAGAITAGKALFAMAMAHPVLAAISVAIVAVVAAFAIFGDSNREVNERTKELTQSLNENLDAINESGTAAERASAGYEALKQSLNDGSEDSNKLTASLGILGLNADHSLRIIRDMGEDAMGTLTELAAEAGIAASEQEHLAKIVNETDNNFKYGAGSGGIYAKQLEDIADASGLTHNEINAIVQAMEEVQDQEEKTDFTKIATEFFTAERGAADLDDELYDLIPTVEELANMTGKEAVEAMDRYASKEAELAAGAQDAEGNLLSQASAQQIVNDQIDAAVAAQQEKNDADAEAQRLAEKNADDARKEANERKALTSAIQEQGRAAIAASFENSTAATRFAAMSDALNTAADAASGARLAFDLLIGTQLEAQATEDAWHASNQALTESFKENGAAMGANTEEGRANRAAIRDSIAAATDMQVANIASATTSEELTTALKNAEIGLGWQREALIDQLEPFHENRAAAAAYVDEMGLTPDLVSTVFEQPGMLQGLLDSEALNVEFDEAGRPVVTAIGNEGGPEVDAMIAEINEGLGLLDKTEALAMVGAEGAPLTDEQIEGIKKNMDDLDGSDAQVTASLVLSNDPAGKLEEIGTALSELDGTTTSPRITLPTQGTVNRELDALQKKFDEFDASTAKPDIDLPDYATVKSEIETLQTKLDALDRTSVSPSITLPGISSRIREVDNLKAAIDRLSNKTITVTVNQVGTLPGDMTGGIETGGLDGFMAGGLVNGPRTLNVGERGYREAVIPLDLPLNRVDPSVRDLAELVRGGGSGVTNVTNVTNEFTIVEATDPEVTARRVVNRIADEVMV